MPPLFITPWATAHRPASKTASVSKDSVTNVPVSQSSLNKRRPCLETLKWVKTPALRSEPCVTQQLRSLLPGVAPGVFKSPTFFFSFLTHFVSSCLVFFFLLFFLSVLIKLKKQDGRCVRRTPFIRPICLPEKSMKFPAGHCCAISGWGRTRESESNRH